MFGLTRQEWKRDIREEVSGRSTSNETWYVHLFFRLFLSLFCSLYQHASGQSPKVKQYNNIRSCITSYFRDRDCVTLPPPLSHEVSLFKYTFLCLFLLPSPSLLLLLSLALTSIQKIRHLSETSIDELNPEFNSKITALVHNVLEKASVKKVLITTNDKSNYHELCGSSMTHHIRPPIFTIQLTCICTSFCPASARIRKINQFWSSTFSSYHVAQCGRSGEQCRYSLSHFALIFVTHTLAMQTAVERYKANMDAVTQPLLHDEPLNSATLIAEHTKYLELSMFYSLLRLVPTTHIFNQSLIPCRCSRVHSKGNWRPANSRCTKANCTCCTNPTRTTQQTNFISSSRILSRSMTRLRARLWLEYPR